MNAREYADIVSLSAVWRTIRGAHVQIDGGKIVKGPSHLVGKSPDSVKNAKRTKEKTPSDKATRAKASHNYTGKDRQHHAKENERVLAKALGGGAYDDSEPVDVTVPDKFGRIAHGLEVKTVTSNKAAKITMDSYSQIRKGHWERKNKATYHTVAIIGDAKDEHFFYRRGIAGSARLGALHEVKGIKNLRRLMESEHDSLPDSAKRNDARVTDRQWGEHRDDSGVKAFRHKKTGEVVKAKK